MAREGRAGAPAQKPSRRAPAAMTGRSRDVDARRRILLALAVVVLVLVVAVAYKYWPPGVTDIVQSALDWLARESSRTWRQVGGRWLTLSAVIVGVGAGLILARRNRWLGITIVELGIAAGAVVALIQPGGW
jgi:hypothetical protein